MKGRIEGQCLFPPPPINDRHAIDITEAPAGYYPVTKASVSPPGANIMICTRCDWRAGCNGSIVSCMPYKRAEGVSVVFKRSVPA